MSFIRNVNISNKIFDTNSSIYSQNIHCFTKTTCNVFTNDSGRCGFILSFYVRALRKLLHNTKSKWVSSFGQNSYLRYEEIRVVHVQRLVVNVSAPNVRNICRHLIVLCGLRNICVNTVAAVR